MPGQYLNANTLWQCPHGGQFKLTPKNPNVTIGGAPVITVTDVPGIPVVPCPAPPKGVPSAVYMCESLVQAVPGCIKLKVKGVPVLTTMCKGITTGVPPGPAIPKCPPTRVTAP